MVQQTPSSGKPYEGKEGSGNDQGRSFTSSKEIRWLKSRVHYRTRDPKIQKISKNVRSSYKTSFDELGIGWISGF